ncbi:uncharacterized protein N7498_001489 [Penicillium cinerascens]|uniref:Fungal N-terminal domain-containing protein n=1 Tax=Penicillium cinerascens TaxID=70096 RepID=A0A9W9NG73_9EURO|nr:uncharacterized protein N7498_001489 [Penicillium cinerascens]KAJ5219390.1 hypothetical protein N7498_001489 [Penicillium cinerascens]
MMVLPQVPGTQPAHQIAVLRPLADSLYDSTRESTDLINQAHNELGLLLTVLGTAETQSSFLGDRENPELEKTLERCHTTLLDLEKLQSCSEEVGPQSQISDIRARFSDLIFELSIANANMMISSQINVSRIVRGFIDDVKSGKREAKIVASALDDTSSSGDQESAWEKLQHELQDAGIAPQLTSQNRDIIMSTLRKAADQEELLKNITSTAQASDPVDLIQPPSDQVVEPQAASQEKGISDKEVIPKKEENFPIPVAFEIQDTDDSSKHAWATITSPMEDFPIPVLSEPSLMAQDTDKQVVPLAWQPDTLPIPVETENRRHSRASITSSSAFKSQQAMPTIARGKKPSLMSRMKFKWNNSKDEFVALIQMGEVCSVKYALDKGADVNTMNSQGQTALMVAVSYGHEDVISLLLEYGAKMDKIGTHGETALGVAALRGFDDIAQLLLVHGTNPNCGKNMGKTALSQAAISGSLTVATLLLDCGADPNAVSSNGATALVCAADSGRMQISQLLLERGALVDKCGYPRRTPLFKAVQRGNIGMVELLLSSGADAHLQDVHKQTPMSLAISLGRDEIVSIFYQHGLENESHTTGATGVLHQPAGPGDVKSSAIYQYY